MRVLVACEEIQEVCKAFRARGHEAYSCDIQHCALWNHLEWHIVEEAEQVIGGNCRFTTVDGKNHSIEGHWDLIIAHPPCTYLSNLGAKHLYLGTERVRRQNDVFRLMNEERVRSAIRARDFFLLMLNAPSEHVCVENPVPSKIWQLPPPTQMIEPWQFGEPYKKRTYLWMRGLPSLEPTKIVEPKYLWIDGGHAEHAKMETFGFRDSKKRARTFPGIARAMAEQWG